MSEKTSLHLAISTTRQLQETDPRWFEKIFFGYPFCLELKDNPLSAPESLELALRNFPEKQKIILNTPIRPLENQLPLVSSLLEKARELGLSGVCLNSIGMIEWVKSQFHELEIYLDGFANLYTRYDLELVKELGVKGVVPAPEIDLTERSGLLSQEIEIITPIQGNLPLAFSRYCFFYPQAPQSCPNPCRDAHILSYPQGKIRQMGKALFSEQNLCLLPHISGLQKKGFHSLRIEGWIMTPEQINRSGEVYRRALGCEVTENPPDWPELFPEGFCNGFYFAARGADFIP